MLHKGAIEITIQKLIISGQRPVILTVNKECQHEDLSLF